MNNTTHTSDSTAIDSTATDDCTLEAVCDRLEKLTERVDELEAELERKDERIDELEDELAAYKDFAGSEFADVRGRITDVEEQAQAAQVPSDEPTDADDPTHSQPSETPLERICSLPEHVADRELTANQERARFIARDVRDYAEKAPAGLVIDSQTIKKVITAAEGKKPHTQTVARIMNFLEKLGKDEVKQTKRRGKKLVVVDPEAADRYHDRCDRVNEQAPTESVMS